MVKTRRTALRSCIPRPGAFRRAGIIKLKKHPRIWKRIMCIVLVNIGERDAGLICKWADKLVKDETIVMDNFGRPHRRLLGSSRKMRRFRSRGPLLDSKLQTGEDDFRGRIGLALRIVDKVTLMAVWYECFYSSVTFAALSVSAAFASVHVAPILETIAGGNSLDLQSRRYLTDELPRAGGEGSPCGDEFHHLDPGEYLGDASSGEIH